MEIGEKKISKHTVTEAETADKVGSGGLPVFSTPSMIALMEKTAGIFDAIDDSIDGEDRVRTCEGEWP